MIQERLNCIRNVIQSFTGREGEPGNDNERYILKSLWIMMLSEFEGSIKDQVENYLDYIKTKESSEVHICLLLQNHYGDSEEPLTIGKITSVYKKRMSEINYNNFTRNRKAKYKTFSIESLFNKLGIFFNESEKLIIKKLDSIATTRDSIAHGDSNVSITKNEMMLRLTDLEEIFSMLSSKLSII